MLLLEHLSSGPVTVTQIKTMTRQDKVLSRVLYFVQNGWPTTVEQTLKPYASRKTSYLHLMVVSYGVPELLYL